MNPWNLTALQARCLSLYVTHGSFKKVMSITGFSKTKLGNTLYQARMHMGGLNIVQACVEMDRYLRAGGVLDFTEAPHHNDRVAEFLKMQDRPISRAEIAAALGVKPYAVTDALTTLRKRGEAHQPSPFVWSYGPGKEYVRPKKTPKPSPIRVPVFRRVASVWELGSACR